MAARRHLQLLLQRGAGQAAGWLADLQELREREVGRLRVGHAGRGQEQGPLRGRGAQRLEQRRRLGGRGGVAAALGAAAGGGRQGGGVGAGVGGVGGVGIAACRRLHLLRHVLRNVVGGLVVVQQRGGQLQGEAAGGARVVVMS
jgi:hypothetical protein